jgi:hypothetical protein
MTKSPLFVAVVILAITALIVFTAIQISKKPDIILNGKAFKINTTCTKDSAMYIAEMHYGYSYRGKYEWHYGYHHTVKCVAHRIDTVEMKDWKPK